MPLETVSNTALSGLYLTLSLRYVQKEYISLGSNPRPTYFLSWLCGATNHKPRYRRFPTGDDENAIFLSYINKYCLLSKFCKISAKYSLREFYKLTAPQHWSFPFAYFFILFPISSEFKRFFYCIAISIFIVSLNNTLPPAGGLLGRPRSMFAIL